MCVCYSYLAYSLSDLIVSNFSKVCLAECGITFKFWLGVCPIAPCFKNVCAGGGGGVV